MKESFKRIPKTKIEREGEKYGGSDYRYWEEYEMEDDGDFSFNKGGHRARSIADDPNHLEYWKKMEYWKKRKRGKK